MRPQDGPVCVRQQTSLGRIRKVGFRCKVASFGDKMKIVSVIRGHSLCGCVTQQRPFDGKQRVCAAATPPISTVTNQTRRKMQSSSSWNTGICEVRYSESLILNTSALMLTLMPQKFLIRFVSSLRF